MPPSSIRALKAYNQPVSEGSRSSHGHNFVKGELAILVTLPPIHSGKQPRALFMVKKVAEDAVVAEDSVQSHSHGTKEGANFPSMLVNIGWLAGQKWRISKSVVLQSTLHR